MQLHPYEREHIERLRGALAECTVLLKTSGNFPLAAPGPLALYGSGARHTVKGGTGSGEVNSRYFVTVEQCLRDAGFTLTTAAWLDAYDRVREQAQQAFYRQIRADARAKHTVAILEGMGKVMPEPDYDLPLDGAGDTAVYVLARISGEGSDRTDTPGDIRLTDTEARDILALQKQYKRFLLVLNTGGPVNLSPVADAVGDILVLSQLGVETGTALAEILLGRQNPSGKLTATWAPLSAGPEMAEFGDINDTRYREGVYVGYRWFDTVGKAPLFPFGFGLSYTQFACRTLGVKAEGAQVTVTAAVRNTGARPGKETVQVYVSSPAGRLDKPYQALAGFAKTKTLAPGEEQTLTVAFPLDSLASYDTVQAAYVLEAGDYIVRVGTSSRDTAPAAVLALDSEAVCRRVKNCLGTPDFADWAPPQPAAAPRPDVPVAAVHAADLPCTAVACGDAPAIPPEVQALSDRELALLNTGAFDAKGGALSIIGNAGKSVAGAAGETTGALKDKGFPVLVMADGPAGLRLDPQFYRDEKGVHGLGQGMMPQSMLALAPAPLRLLMKLLGGSGKPPKNAELQDQYATALPIGTALAQSWNPELARACGEIVGDEMARFGVQLWLAPALNIQRSARCGRNFEYYSEDPLLSGKMAAAVTAGVQTRPGCGVTIKHFAANNQETNRYNSNSQVSERAMREIYLRGFEICVREAAPRAVMTSYNLLNGVHTSESRALTLEILRGEWGYEGIVMTDWIIAYDVAAKGSAYPAAQAGRIAAAGGQLVMPGGQGDVDGILAALADGTLTRRQLEENAARLLASARALTVRA